MNDIGRDELIDAKRERERLIAGMATIGKAIEVLMDDRVRYLAALRQIALMGESGTYLGDRECWRIAREALEPHLCECGRRVPEGAWADGYRSCRDHLSDGTEKALARFDQAAGTVAP